MTRLTPSPFREMPNGEPWSDEQNGRLIRLGNENPDLSWEEFKIKFDFPHTPDELERQYRHLMPKNPTLKRSRSEDDDGDATRYSTPTRPRPKRSKSESNVDDSIQRDAFNQSDPIRPRSPDWKLPSSDASNKSRKTQQPPDQSVSMRDSYSHYRSPELEISSTSTSRSPQAQAQRERTPPVNPAASTHSHDKNPTMPSTSNLLSLPHRPAPVPPRAPQIPSSSRPQSGDAQRVEDILPYHMRRGSLPSEGNMSSIGIRLAVVHGIGESLLEELERIGRNITTVSGQLNTVFGSEPTEPPTRAIPPVNTGPGPTTEALEQRPAGSPEVVDSQNQDAGDGPGGDEQTREDMGGEEPNDDTCMDTDAHNPREDAGEKR